MTTVIADEVAAMSRNGPGDVLEIPTAQAAGMMRQIPRTASVRSTRAMRTSIRRRNGRPGPLRRRRRIRPPFGLVALTKMLVAIRSRIVAEKTGSLQKVTSPMPRPTESSIVGTCVRTSRPLTRLDPRRTRLAGTFRLTLWDGVMDVRTPIKAGECRGGGFREG